MRLGEPPVCADGRSCTDENDCRSPDPPRVDTCERTPDGAVGCREGESCIMTSVGVRRCMRVGCDPRDPFCSRQPCLADPEDSTSFVCWLGGTVEILEPCDSPYDCRDGYACNAVGVCSYVCAVEGEPCLGGLVDHVCRDYVCSPAEP